MKMYSCYHSIFLIFGYVMLSKYSLAASKGNACQNVINVDRVNVQCNHVSSICLIWLNNGK